MKIAAIGILMMTGTCLAELPGLPAPAASAEPRVEQHKAPVVSNTGPIRGSLFKMGMDATPPSGPEGTAGQAQPTSYISVQPTKPKRYQKNDIVTVVVRQDSQSTTNGTANSKKTQDFDLAFQQFLQLGTTANGVPMATNVSNPSSLPEIKFKYANDRQSDASQNRQDSLAWRISATVVDVKPNGTIVLQATAHLSVDKEQQDYTLSGICRVEDIAVDNTILSTQLADLSVSKQTKGEVRDGTRRGWLNQIIDVVNPF
jgi:flagellar L-ring protein precursor FlgH